MRGYQAKCPNLVQPQHINKNSNEKVVCGYEGYEVLVKGIFTKESGFDPLALKVKCRRCGNEYYLFPRFNFKELSTNGS